MILSQRSVFQMGKQPYLDRRGILMERLQKGLIFVPGSSGCGVNPNFVYLTGLCELRGALLMAPGGTRIGTGRLHPGPDYVRGRIAQQVLFLPPGDPLAAQWGEDSAATLDSVTADELGMDAVIGSGEMNAVLAQSLAAASLLFYVRGTPPSLDGDDDSDARFVARLRRRFIGLEVRDGSRDVHEMRRLKDADEVAAIEAAVAVTAKALDRVLGLLGPGIEESAIEGEITRVYRAAGARHAFDPIVGAGPNALSLHYKENSRSINEGDLLLIDTGAALRGYGADISRTYPAGGRYSDRQREVYEVVLRAEEAAIAAARPGMLMGDLHAVAWKLIDDAGLAEHFVHGLGHHLGLETHDVGDVHRPLQPGAVITIEPGVYISSEGIGVRIEDDVLITEEGCRVLSEAIPRRPDEIEARMAGE
jgi:Xaa-Pro aminopeptidase